MVLSQDFKEFIELLNKNKVQYLIIGGYAVAFHGHPRYTKDLDIFVNRTDLNSKKIARSLQEFGLEASSFDSKDFLEEDFIVQLGLPPNRIDILTGVKGITFEECFSSKIVEKIEDIQAFFIDLESLKRNKKATGRHQDLADLENLE